MPPSISRWPTITATSWEPPISRKLDDYLSKLSPAPTDASVMPASATPPAPVVDAGVNPVNNPARNVTPTDRGTTDTKQAARWKLQSAKEQMRMGNYDDAAKLVAEVRQMPVKWGLFDETPDKVGEAIAKARPKLTGASAVATPHTKEAAVAKLKEARSMLASNQFEQAEAIAIDVESWGMNFGRWEDKPSKVADAARALQRRDQTRALPVKAQPSLGVYDVLVGEARHLLAEKKLAEAEVKARQAMQLNVRSAAELGPGPKRSSTTSTSPRLMLPPLRRRAKRRAWSPNGKPTRWSLRARVWKPPRSWLKPTASKRGKQCQGPSPTRP